MPDQRRQLAAIMFTDIVGYTSLMGKDSSKAMELVRQSVGFQKSLVEKHNGKWLKEMGDGVLARFNSALDAVNCAIEIQATARAKFEGKLRIGIHSGDITIENNDVYGDGVNVASRLESIADPGGIYISESIEKAIRGQPNVQAKFLGEVKLKNVDYDVRTYALQGVGLPVPELSEKKQLSGRFMAELQRRSVIRAAITYIILSLFLILLLPYVKSLLTLPEWAMTAMLVVLIIGFPIALYLAWNYERSPEGLIKTTSQKSWQNPYKTGQKKPLSGNILIWILLIALFGIFVYNYYRVDEGINTSNIEKSIAVLPFRNDSPGEENMYFCNGIREGILDHLAKIPELTVVSNTSVDLYREDLSSIADIARELNVNYILEGSVLRVGDRAKITAQLIYTPENKYIWSNQFDKKIENVETIFIVLADVAQDIAGELKAKISPELQERIETIPTSDLIAYDYYLQGKEFYYAWWKTFNNSNLIHAERLFDNAIKRDSTFALAYAGKAAVLARRAYEQANVEKNYLDSVRKYCDKAISLDPNTAFAYVIRGLYYNDINKVKKAESDLKKAVELNPNDPFIIRGLAILYYDKMGDYLAAIKLLKRAEKVGRDPGHLYATYARMSHVYRNIGDWEKVEFYMKKSREMNPLVDPDIRDYIVQGKFKKAIEILENRPDKDQRHIGECYLMLGEYDSALYYLGKVEEKRKENNPENYNVNAAGVRYGQALVGAGRTEKGMGILRYNLQKNEKIIDLDNGGIFQALFDNAGLYSFFGETEKAIEYLQRYNETSCWREGTFYLMLVDPLFDNIRNAPEYLEMVNNVHAKNTAMREKIAELQTSGDL